MILDTNALSAVVDGDRTIRPRLASVTVVAIPVIALGEFRFGLAQSRRRQDYEQWLDKELSNFRVLDVDQATSVSYAKIRQELKQAGSPIPVNDLWIAALARQHRMPVLSRDGHFDAVAGLQRLNW